MFTSYNSVSVPKSEGVPDCESCVAVVNQMKEVLKDPHFQTEIKTDMESQICTSLGFLREVVSQCLIVFLLSFPKEYTLP